MWRLSSGASSTLQGASYRLRPLLLPRQSVLVPNDAGRGHSHTRKDVTLEDNEWVDSVPAMPKNWTGPGNVVTWGGTGILSAVAASHSDIARWLYDNTPHLKSEDEMHAIFERAVMNGDFEVAEYLLPRGRKISEYVGDLMVPDAIEGMLKRGFLQENKSAAAAAIWISARKGNLDLMKRIAAYHPKPPRGKNSPWLQFWEYAMHAASAGGDVAILKWVLEHPTGKLLHKHMKEDAIMDRFNELLQHAAAGGHVETMEYLVQQGCTDKYAQAMVNAARKGHLNCIEWLLEHTPPRGKNSPWLQFWEYAMHAASAGGDVAILKWVLEHPTGKLEAAANGHLVVVQWLYANRSEGCTTKAMDLASRNGHLKVVQWLHAITTAGCTTKAMEEAASNGHLEVVKWLHANRLGNCTVKTVENAIGAGNLRLAVWLKAQFPHHVPQQNRLWRFPKNLFDTLLFLKVNYPDVLTLEFGQAIKSDLSDSCYHASDILVKDWLEENYPGRPSRKREVYLWSL